MCANDREELRRPGLSGGGGGKPLDLGGTLTAAAAGATTGAVATNFCGALVAIVSTALAALAALAALDGAVKQA